LYQRHGASMSSRSRREYYKLALRNHTLAGSHLRTWRPPPPTPQQQPQTPAPRSVSQPQAPVREQSAPAPAPRQTPAPQPQAPVPVPVPRARHAGGRPVEHKWESAAQYVDRVAKEKKLPRNSEGKPIKGNAVKLMTEWFEKSENDPPSPGPRQI